MKRLIGRLTIVLAVAGALLAIPAAAGAATICVNAGTACPAGGDEVVGLQNALTRAGDQDGDDEVLLGDKLTPYFGPFVYNPTIPSRFNGVKIKGVGGRPSLTSPSGDAILTMDDGAIENIELRADFGEGVAGLLSGVDMKGVKVTGPPSFAPDTYGVTVRGPATLEDIEVTGGFQEGITAVGTGLAEDDLVARRLRMHDGVAIGVHVTDSGEIDVSDSRIDAVDAGIGSTGFLSLRRSVVTTSAAGSIGLSQFGGSNGPLDLDHVTVAHVGRPDGNDSAFSLQALAPMDSHLHAVAIAGYTRGFRRPLVNGSPPSNVVISDSAWNPSNDQLGPGTGVFVEQRNSHVAPAVTSLAGGDLHLLAGSSAIDRDEVSDAAQFADLDGVSAQDGDGDGAVRPDAGAFEFRPAPAPAGGGAPGGDAPGGSTPAGGTPAPDVVAPALKRLRLTTGGAPLARAARVTLPRARKLRLAFTATEAARVRIVPRRVTPGAAGKPRRAIVAKTAAGKGSIALGRALARRGLLRPGTVRLLVTATDAAGNRSAKTALTIRLTG